MVTEILVICAALALSGMIKGVTGAGIAIVSLPTIAAFQGVPAAIAIMIVPTLATNLWQLRQNWDARHGLEFLTLLFVMGGVGIIIGTWLLVQLPPAALSVALATVILIYIALRTLRPHWHLTETAARTTSPWVGLAVGVLQGTTGVSGPLSLVYLSSIRLTRSQFVFAAAMLFACYTAVQVPALAVAGVLTWHRALLSVLATLPVMATVPLGGWIGARISQRRFDQLILVMLAIIAGKLIYDSGVFT